MSHVWLRMSDDFWLHLRPSVKFRACHVAPRVMHRPPTPDTKFRHLYMIDIRLIAVDRLRVPRFGHRPGSFSLSFSLLLPLPLSLSLLLLFFCTKLTVISEISISSLPRVCWGCGPTRTLSRIQTSPHRSHPTPPIPPRPPSFSQSSGFLRVTTKRNISTGRVLPRLPIFTEAIIAHRSSDCPFGSSPSLRYSSPFIDHTSVYVPPSPSPCSLPTRSPWPGSVTETRSQEAEEEGQELRRSLFISSFTPLALCLASIFALTKRSRFCIPTRVAATLGV